MKVLRILILSAIVFLFTVGASSAPMLLATAPAVPSPQSPVGGALVINYLPTLRWSNTSADHYEVIVGTDATFVTWTEDDASVTTPYQTLTTTLNPATTYYWRVMAFDAANNHLGWSGTASFRTALLPPTLSIPNDGATLENNRPIFQWSSVLGASGYNLQVSTTTLFSTTLINVSVPYTSSQYQPSTPLPSNVTLYWRVRTLSSTYGPSDWSMGPVGKYFTIASTTLQPSIPALLKPDNGKMTTDSTPRLIWKAVTIPSATTFSYYQVQVSTSSQLVVDNAPDANGFSHTGELTSPFIDDSTTTTQVMDTSTSTAWFDVPDPASALSAATTYYWHVRAVNTYGSNTYYGDWSSVFKLLIAYNPVTLVNPPDASTLLTNRPSFSWTDPNPLPHNGYYWLQISTTPNFGGTLLVNNFASNPWRPSTPLPANKTLYWRVQIVGSIYAPTLWGSAGINGNFFTLTTANPPSVPTLKYPASNALVTNYSPTFLWSVSSLPLGTTFDHYQIEISTSTSLNPDGSFATPVISDGSATNQFDPEFTPGAPLNPATKYYWHVQACNSVTQCSMWSTMLSFRTVLPYPTLTTYGGGPWSSPFSWSAVTGATGYNIQVSPNSNFSVLSINTNTTGPQFSGGSGLPSGTYYWRVRALSSTFGPSSWQPAPPDSYTK